MAVNTWRAPGDVAVVPREEATRLSKEGDAVGGSVDYLYEFPSYEQVNDLSHRCDKSVNHDTRFIHRDK